MKKIQYKIAKALWVFFVTLVISFSGMQAANATYESKGIGGGGAMDGFSMSPYTDGLWFVGTDMGQIYKSIDSGANWKIIDHSKTTYSYDLPNSAPIGFSADGSTLFHAPRGCEPQRSTDQGENWEIMSSLQQLFPIGGHDYAECKDSSNTSRVRYWVSDPANENVMYAAGGDGLYKTNNKGDNWWQVAGPEGESKGTFIDTSTSPHTIYHASDTKLYKSTDGGGSFSVMKTQNMIGFAGGRDSNGLTLSYIDTNEAACAASGISLSGSNNQCGYVWVSTDGTNFSNTGQAGGDFVKMADNNSQIIYATGHESWVHAGTAVYKSENAGGSFSLIFQQYRDFDPYYWPAEKLDYSAVGLDVGYWDDGYFNFAVNKLNASKAGGTGQFFLHTTENAGENWQSPFTVFADSGERAADKKWRSNGLEMTSSTRIKFDPSNSNIIYAGYADIGGLVSEDGGNSWYIRNPGHNTTYDYAFNGGTTYAATSGTHDWPHEWYKQVLINQDENSVNYIGGIWKTADTGKNWTRLTPDNYEWDTPFLSVAYNEENGAIYAGSQGRGVARSTDGGASWEWFNDGFGGSDKIIPQIEVDPVNGDVYALLTGDYLDRGNGVEVTNHSDIGVYVLPQGSVTWQKLKGTVHRPEGVDEQYDLWDYPTSFTIDWNDPDRNTIYLSDMRVFGYLTTGIWKTTDRGENWYRKLYQVDPTGITIHPENKNHIYVAGRTDGAVQGGESMTGAMYSSDGGETWNEHDEVPVRYSTRTITFSPNDTSKMYYATTGAGMIYVTDPLYQGPSSDGSHLIVTAPGKDHKPEVKTFDYNGNKKSSFNAFPESFEGGVRIATCDLDNDGSDEIITGAGEGGSPHVRIFSQTGSEKFIAGGFFPYAKNFKGGVYIACGDINGDGSNEIITGAGNTGGPHVRTFNRNGEPIFSPGFFAYGRNFRGGVQVATGDLNGDGTDEIITGTGVGGGPHVRIFNKIGEPQFTPGFFAYGENFRGGVYVAAADIDKNGKDEIVTGTGYSGGPHIRTFNFVGTPLFTPGFFAYDERFRGGAVAAAGDLNGDNKAEIITGTGPSGGPHVRIFTRYAKVYLSNGFFAYSSSFRGGVNVATGKF